MASPSSPQPAPLYLRPVCFALKWLCLGVALVMVLAIVGIGVAAFFWGNDLGPNFKISASLEGVPANSWTIGSLLVAVGAPLIALIWGLWHGSRLFGGLGRGEYFSRPTALALRNFAFGLLVYKLLPLVTVPLWAVVVGHPEALFSDLRDGFDLKLDPFKMDGVLTIIFLGMIAVFAQVMTKAAEIAEDNAQIV